MADRRAQYKKKGRNFGNAELRRIDRIETQDKRRKERRSHNLSRLRSLDEDTKTHIPGKSTVSRNEKLEKWKQEKEVKKKSEKKIVKPPFKVGIVHHRAFSPAYNKPSLPSCSHWNSNFNIKSQFQQQTSPVKRITRVTQKRLAAKAAMKAAAEASANKSFAPLNHKFKPPTGLPNIPLFGRVRKESMDESKFSWNISDEKIPRMSEIQNSAKSDGKISNSLFLDSPRSKKFKASLDDKEIQNSPKVVKTRLSVARKNQDSDLSTDSLSLQVSSDDTEGFDSPLVESSSMNVETQKKESALTETFINFVQPLETNQIACSKSDEILQSNSLKSSPAVKDNLQLNLTRTERNFEQYSGNYSLRLQVTDLSPKQQNCHVPDLENGNFPQIWIETRFKLGPHLKSIALDQTCLVLHSRPEPDLIFAARAVQGVNSSKSAEEIFEEFSQTESEKIDALPSEIAEKSFSDTFNAAIFSSNNVVNRRGKKEASKKQNIRRGFKKCFCFFCTCFKRH